jgi:hypothetical protein
MFFWIAASRLVLEIELPQGDVDVQFLKMDYQLKYKLIRDSLQDLSSHQLIFVV